MKKYIFIFSLLFFALGTVPTIYPQVWMDNQQVQFNLRGDWNNSTAYEANDAVRGSNGRLYVASAAVTGGNNPGSTDPPPSPWATILSNVPGQRGIGLGAIYIASSTTPTLPVSPSYNGNTFSNLGSWSNTAPTTGIVWTGIYNIAANNALSNGQVIRMTGTAGADSTVPGPTGTGGTSFAFILQRKTGAAPTLPGGNTGTRSGSQLIAAPSGWSLTDPGGTDPLYIAMGLLPGGNNNINWVTLAKISGEKGQAGSDSVVPGPTGIAGDSFTFIFQRKTGAAPTLPTDNTGTRTGSQLTTAPPGWSLTDPGGTDPLYLASARLPGANTDIDWLLVAKMTGEKGRDGTDSTVPGPAGENGDSTREIYRKVNQYDYTTVPTVTSDGTTLTLPDQWSLTPYNSQKFEEWSLPTTTPQDIAIDLDTDIVYILASTMIHRTNLRGANTPSNSSWPLRAGNDSPRSITIVGDDIWILDDEKRSANNNFFYSIFVHAKTDGGYKRTITIPTGDMDPAPVKIAYNDGKIYVISNRNQQSQGDRKAIRVFNVAGVEQTNEGLELLISSITDVKGFEADGRYLYIMDGTDDRVYIFERVDPLRRRTSLEFELDTSHTSPIGFALSEFEAHVIQGTNNNNIIYYNPRNILWASRLFILGNSPYTVAASPIFWKTPERSDGGSGAVTIIQQSGGTSTSGTAGTNGNSVTFIFRKNLTRPTTPTTSEGTYDNGSYMPPSGWTTTLAAAEAQSGDGSIWLSFVKLSGDGDTILSYEVATNITGPRGPPGASIDFVFQRSNTQPVTPASNSGTTNAAGDQLATAPAGWHLDISHTTGNNDLYVSLVRLQGTNRVYQEPESITGDPAENVDIQYSIDGISYHDSVANPYFIRFSTDGGTSWEAGQRFRQDGNSVEFQFSADNISWRTTGQNTDKYIRFRSGSTENWSTGVKFAGDDGADGAGLSVEYSIDGSTLWHSTLATADYFIRLRIGTGAWSIPIQFRGYPLLIQYSSDGNAPWTTTFDKYIRFSTDNGVTWISGRIAGEDGDDSLELQFSSNNVDFHNTLVSTDQYIRFRVGNTGPWSDGGRFGGPPGGFQTTLFQRSTTQPTAPTNVTYNPTSLGNPYGGTIGSWTPDVPNGTDQLWRVSVTVPPRTTTGNLSVTVNGSVYSEQGTHGTDGRWYRNVYQWSQNEPSDPSGLSYNIQNGTIDGLGQWREAPAQIRDIPLWIAVIRINGSTATYILKYQDPAIQGPAGEQGDSIGVIYRRSTTDPTAPTGGTWNGSDFDPPTNWHESDPGGTAPVYMIIVRLSGTNRTNTGITYGSIVRLTGRDGQDAPGLPASIDPVTFMFVQDTSDQTISLTKPAGDLEWPRGYHEIKEFTGGTTGLATQDATGITIAEAGLYSITVQSDIHILGATQTFPDSEWGFELDIEDSSGTMIHNYIFASHINDGSINQNIIVPVYGSVVPTSLPAGAKVFCKLFYQRLGVSNQQAHRLTQDFVFRVLNVAGDDDRLVIRRYTATGGTGTGSGSNGNSLSVVYRRSTTRLTTPPTGGTAHNGELVSAPTGWSISVPSGTDPIYVTFAHINGATQSIRYDEPVPWQGPVGTSIMPFYLRTANDTNPGQPGITYNGLAFGGMGSWITTTQGTGDYLWVVIVSFDKGVNNSQTVTNPVLMSRPGRAGTDGDDGDSVRNIYQRATSRPATPTGGTWDGTTYTQPSGWSLNIPGGTNRVYAVDVSLSGTNKTNTGISYSSVYPITAIDGINGEPGRSELSIYRASTTDPGTPTGGRIGTAGLPSSYTAPAGWSFTPPARSTTADIYRAIVTIPGSGTTPSYTRAFFLEVRASGSSTTPTGTSASVSLTYGVLDTDGVTSVVAQTAGPIHLERGGTHNFSVQMPATRAAQQYFYASVPTGFTITSVSDELEGTVTSAWPLTGQQRRFGPLRRANTQSEYTFTIRRNN